MEPASGSKTPPGQQMVRSAAADADAESDRNGAVPSLLGGSSNFMEPASGSKTPPGQQMVRSASASSSAIGLVPVDPFAASTTSSGCDGNRAVPSIIAPAETAATSDFWWKLQLHGTGIW